MADEKIFADELLSDDELDNIAGGTGGQTNRLRELLTLLVNSTKRNTQTPPVCNGDERNIDPAFMSAAFINGEITGGEDF